MQPNEYFDVDRHIINSNDAIHLLYKDIDNHIEFAKSVEGFSQDADWTLFGSWLKTKGKNINHAYRVDSRNKNRVFVVQISREVYDLMLKGGEGVEYPWIRLSLWEEEGVYYLEFRFTGDSSNWFGEYQEFCLFIFTALMYFQSIEKTYSESFLDVGHYQEVLAMFLEELHIKEKRNKSSKRKKKAWRKRRYKANVSTND